MVRFKLENKKESFTFQHINTTKEGPLKKPVRNCGIKRNEDKIKTGLHSCFRKKKKKNDEKSSIRQISCLL